MQTDTNFFEPCDGGADVDSIAAQAVKFGDDQDVSFSILSSSLKNPARCVIAMEPEIVSVIMRCGTTVKPAALISWIWFSGVCSNVETRA
jgi:hypothetical protein